MRLQRWIRHNFGWKLVALLMALLVWLTIKASMRAQGFSGRRQGLTTTATLRLSLPVSVLAPAGDDAVFTISPGWVDVSLAMPLQLGSQGIDQRQVRAYVDLTEAMPGGIGGVRRVWVRAPEGTTVAEVLPAEVEVKKALPAAPDAARTTAP